MWVLYILSALIILVLLLLILPINLIFSYKDKVGVRVRALFFTVDLLKLLEKSKKNNKQKVPEHKTEKTAPKRKNTFGDFMAFIDLIKSTAKMLGENISSGLEIYVKKLDVVIASDSADKTALMYSSVTNAVAILLELLPNIVSKLHYKCQGIRIVPDYLSEKSLFSAEVVFRMKLWQLLKILFSALNIFNKNTKKRIIERNMEQS